MLAASPNWRGTYPMSSANGPAPIPSIYGPGANGIPFGSMNAMVSPAPVHKLDPIGSLITANSIIHFIKSLDRTDAAIAGGYARDTYFGRIPRDIDIMVVKQDREDWTLTELFNIESFLRTLGAQVEVHLHYDTNHGSGGTNDAIAVCFKIPELCIDIVLYSKHYCSIPDVLTGFDANINQFVINNNGVAKFAGYNSSIGNLQFLHSQVFRPTVYRMNRTLALAKEVGW